MRTIFILFTLFGMLLLTNCSKKNNSENPVLNQYIKQVDSLNEIFTETYNDALEKIYAVSDDSLKADSLSKVIEIPDTLLFFQYLTLEVNSINESYYNIQQELFFAKDQLNGLKEDLENNEISQIQFELQLEAQERMLKTICERSDSNMMIFKHIIHILKEPSDSLKHEKQ